jgi:pimeloyl-ACP methyl ester carboxylesterase
MPSIDTEIRIPVYLSRYGQAEVACHLTPAAAGKGAVCLVVGIPGTTYDGSYFTCPVPGYSFAARAAEGGLAFLAVDRLGTGRSAPVPASVASLDADAAAAAAAARWGRRRFDHVVLLGHGLGAMIATCAAARLAADGGQPDLLVLTSAGHAPQADLGPVLLVPASSDPRFPSAGEGWLVALDPGVRQRVFHSPATDPAVLAWDAGTMLSSRQFRELHDWAVQAPGQGPCAQVTAPVLLVAGQEDRLLAGITGNGDAGLAAAEHPYYRRSSAFAARVIPRAPHSLAPRPVLRAIVRGDRRRHIGGRAAMPAGWGRTMILPRHRNLAGSWQPVSGPAG